jgi:ABC-type antimicrobial peptide transport system permease subunit
VEVALMSTMAVLALALSTLGIFALVASVVAQKKGEIGLRMALGSSVNAAMLHSGAPGLRAAALGLFMGLILCAGVLRAMHSVLYGIGVYDAPTILIVVLMLTSVTVFATILPTLRIAGIDPASTLREE